MYSAVVLLALAGCAAASVIGINPNALPVPLDTATVALAKNAQLVQQAAEGTRNILGGGVPAALPADTHEVAAGKVAHAIAIEKQRAIVGSGARLVAAAPAGIVATNGLVGSGLVGTGLVGSGLVGSGLVGSGLVGSGLVGTGLVSSGLVGSGLIAGNGVVSTNGLIGAGIVGNGLIGNGLIGNGLIGNGLVATNGLVGAGLVGKGLVATNGLVGAGLVGAGPLGLGLGAHW